MDPQMYEIERTIEDYAAFHNICTISHYVLAKRRINYCHLLLIFLLALSMEIKNLGTIRLVSSDMNMVNISAGE